MPDRACATSQRKQLLDDHDWRPGTTTITHTTYEQPRIRVITPPRRGVITTALQELGLDAPWHPIPLVHQPQIRNITTTYSLARLNLQLEEVFSYGQNIFHVNSNGVQEEYFPEEEAENVPEPEVWGSYRRRSARNAGRAQKVVESEIGARDDPSRRGEHGKKGRAEGVMRSQRACHSMSSDEIKADSVDSHGVAQSPSIEPVEDMKVENMERRVSGRGRGASLRPAGQPRGQKRKGQEKAAPRPKKVKIDRKYYAGGSGGAGRYVYPDGRVELVGGNKRVLQEKEEKEKDEKERKEKKKQKKQTEQKKKREKKEGKEKAPPKPKKVKIDRKYYPGGGGGAGRYVYPDGRVEYIGGNREGGG